ncbi:MAG: NAD-dependent epimerase/dehydratase family protein [Pseudomonadota bacterium]
MRTIAILGANGRLSNAAASAFQKSGYRVIAITRSGNANGLRGIEKRAADAMDRDALIRATSGADIIFNGLNPLYTRWQKQVLPMGENVMAAARHHGALHLFPGNVYNYGRSIPAFVTDSSPQKAETRKGRIRVQVEEIFEKAAATDAVRTIVLRAGDFYGTAGTGSWFDLVIAKNISKGVYTYPGPGNIPHSWAYLPDLAQAFVRLAEKAADLPVHGRYLFPGHTMTGDDLKRYCETAVGRSLKRAGVPWPLLRIGGLIIPMLREVSEVAYLWDRPHQLDGGALEAVIGAIPQTDPQAAVAQALVDQRVEVDADCASLKTVTA